MDECEAEVLALLSLPSRDESAVRDGRLERIRMACDALDRSVQGADRMRRSYGDIDEALVVQATGEMRQGIVSFLKALRAEKTAARAGTDPAQPSATGSDRLGAQESERAGHEGDASDHEVMEAAASRHLDAAPGEDDYPDDFEDTLQRPLTGGSPSAAPAAPPSAPEAPSPPARPASASPADDYEDDFEQTLQGEPEVQVTDSFLLLKEVEQMQTQKDQAATPQPQGEPSPVEQPQGELSPVGRYDETEDFELESDEDDDDDDDDELLDVADSKPAALQEFRSSDSIDLVTDGEDGGGGAAAYSREDEFEDDSVESLS